VPGAVLVHEDLDVGIRAQQRTRGPGVIEVDVREQQLPNVASPYSLRSERFQ
jgi:hypothetical protein